MYFPKNTIKIKRFKQLQIYWKYFPIDTQHLLSNACRATAVSNECYVTSTSEHAQMAYFWVVICKYKSNIITYCKADMQSRNVKKKIYIWGHTPATQTPVKLGPVAVFIQPLHLYCIMTQGWLHTALTTNCWFTLYRPQHSYEWALGPHPHTELY